MYISVLFRSLLGYFRGFLCRFIYLIGLVSCVRFRIGNCLVIATSSYIGFLTYVASSISGIYFCGTISVFMFKYSLRFTKSCVYGSSIGAYFSLVFFFYYRSSLSNRRYCIYFTTSSILLMRFLIGKSKYIRIVCGFIYFFYRASTPGLYRYIVPHFFFVFNVVTFAY